MKFNIFLLKEIFIFLLQGKMGKELINWTCTKFFILQPLIKFNFTDLMSTPEIIWNSCLLNTLLLFNLIKGPLLSFSYVLLEEILVYWFVSPRSGPWESEAYIILDELFIFIKFCLGLFIGKETHTGLTSLYMKPAFSWQISTWRRARCNRLEPVSVLQSEEDISIRLICIDVVT